jgi:Gas vesicle synthesis protein GvpL/GvpF
MQKAGSGDPHGFKAAYLVDQEVVGAFAERVGNLNATLGNLKLSCTGPWPPYSFASEELE